MDTSARALAGIFVLAATGACTDHAGAVVDASSDAVTPFLAAVPGGSACPEPASAATPPDAANATPDAAPDATPASGPAPFVGVWRQCAADLTFLPDGRWVQVNHRDRCTSRGTWVVRGERFDMRADGTDCRSAPPTLEGALPVLTHQRLVIVHEALGAPGYATWLSGALPVTRWRITDRTPQERERVTVLRLVGGGPSSVMQGCYWSGDGQCNGIFSCSGNVTQWRTGAGSLAAGLSCTGDCTCGSSLYGPVGADRFEARVTASHCQGVWTGDVVGERVPDEL